MGWSLLLWCMVCGLLTGPSALAAKVSLDLPVKGPYRTGQPIQIIYRFEGVGSVDVPPTIDAGGLLFKYVGSQPVPGRSRGELRLDHGRLYFYEAVPDKPGKFVVRKRVWQPGGKEVRSPGRTLLVRGEPLPPAPPKTRGPASEKSAPAGGETNRLKWLENRAALYAATAPATPPAPAAQATTPVTPRPVAPPRGAPITYAIPPEVASTNVFLGEAVPLTLRFFLRADLTFQDLIRPLVEGDGFFSDPMEELEPATITNKGVPYYQVTLQTTVVPLRTGSLSIPAVKLRGRHSTGAMDPRSPAAGWTDFSQLSDPLGLQVAPLPAEPPDDFTGGVGQFKALAPQIEPRPPQAGEPFTLRLGVQGRGNLRAMQRPVLDPAMTNGWRVYDAGETFERTGADGSGTKFFEYQLVATQDHEETPRATLSYFDPQEKKFARLEFKPEPLRVSADPAAVVAPSPAAVAEAPTVPPPAAPSQPASFHPVLASSWFRALQIFIALLFLGWIWWFLTRRRAGRGPAGRRARLRADYEETRETLRDTPPDRRAFYDAAAQVVVARLGVLEGKPVARTEAGRALERLVPNLAQREELAAILDRSDELNYAAVETGPLDDTERAGVLRVLEMFDESAS